MGESLREHNDVIDVLSDAFKVLKQYEEPDGKITEQLVLNPRIVWYKTQNIASNTFGRMALELENLRSKMQECFYNMSQPRAIVISKQLDGIVQALERSIDAKSSETKRDSNNALSNLIDKLNKKTSERMYTVKGDAKKSLFDGMLGRDRERDSEGD